MTRPILLVHGIWNTGRTFRTMERALVEAKVGAVHTIDLRPNDGSATIQQMAQQVHDAAAKVSESEPIDVVGFSMGALVTRYWVQRGAGRDRVRRFVSISGPHNGTALALLQTKTGVRQMRPNSELLADLNSDVDPWGSTEVHTLWTPFDLMIVPPRSGRLPKSTSDSMIPVALHRWMVSDKRAVHTVVDLLSA